MTQMARWRVGLSGDDDSTHQYHTIERISRVVAGPVHRQMCWCLPWSVVASSSALARSGERCGDWDDFRVQLGSGEGLDGHGDRAQSFINIVYVILVPRSR
jgi:hypothetical protein